MDKYLKIFSDYKLFEVFILGIFSGMPLAVLYVSLMAWLKEDGIGLEVITTFAIARMAYSLKFLWSPFVDYFRVPILWHLGHRKGWLLLCSLLITMTLFAMSRVEPHKSLSLLYFLTITLGFLSATFDINFDAFRIDKIPAEIQGIAAANTVFGYRMGMLIAGAGALEIAHVTSSWQRAFIVLSGIYAISLLILLVAKEPEVQRNNSKSFAVEDLKVAVINPFKDFLRRDFAIITLMAVVLYKLGDAMLGVVSMPFYLELGYDKHQIAMVTKLYGVVATILGTYAGGFLVYRMGQFKGMIISGIAQSVTNISFVWLNHQGGDINALFIAITIENFAGGMGTAALVAYLSLLCKKQYSATQYALLSSAASLCNNTITMYGGTLARSLGWDWFFALTIFLGFPGILILVYLNYRLSTKLVS